MGPWIRICARYGYGFTQSSAAVTSTSRRTSARLSASTMPSLMPSSQCLAHSPNMETNVEQHALLSQK